MTSRIRGVAENVNVNNANSPSSHYPSRLVPRYIPLPDTLCQLRHRFPTVLQSLFLECTRCRRWVAVEVLPSVPDVILEAHVEQCPRSYGSSTTNTTRTDATEKTSQYFSSSQKSERGLGKTSQGPFRHTKRESVGQEVYNYGIDGERQWHSPRLQERIQQNKIQSKAHSNLDSPPGADAQGAAGVRSRELKPEEKLLASLLKDKKELQNGHIHVKASSNCNPSMNLHKARQTRSVSPLETLYIPNPVCFTCGWIDCQKADLFDDLRQTWLSMLYKVTSAKSIGGVEKKEETKISVKEEDGGENANETSLPSMSFHETILALQSQQDAINAELARELDFRRSGRLIAERNKPFKKLPLLHTGELPSLETTDGTFPAPGAITFLNEKGNACEEDDHLSSLLSSAEEKVAKGPTKRGRALKVERLRNAWVQAAMQHLTKHRSAQSHCGEDDNENVALSAFCWVVCDNCGKLRRVAQPFPGGAPFVCALSKSIGACEISEIDGVVNYTADVTEAELRRAAFASPLLPYPLKQRWAQLSAYNSKEIARSSIVVQDVRRGEANNREGESTVYADNDFLSSTAEPEPLLQELRSQIGQRLLVLLRHAADVHRKGENGAQKKRSQKDNPSANEGNSLLEAALPLLKDLSTRMRKRSLGNFCKQILSIPQEFRAKRDNVLKASFIQEHLEDGNEKIEESITSNPSPKETQMDEQEHARKVTGTILSQAVSDFDSKACTEREPKASKFNQTTQRVKSQRRIYETDQEKNSGISSTCMNTPDSTTIEMLPKRQRRNAQTPLTDSVMSDGGRPDSHENFGKRPINSSGGRARHPSLTTTSVFPQNEAVVPEVKRKRGRRPMQEVKQDLKEEVVHWVQCDVCNKWRVVSSPIPQGTAFWECKLRDKKTTCADMDDELMLKKGNTEKRNRIR